VLDIFGTQMVLPVSGGIYGHQKGTPAGAKATMQAVVAWHKGVTLEETAKKVNDLKEALSRWGHDKPS